MTAVEWLYNNLLVNPISNDDIEYNEAVFENAKKMFEKQITTAYNKAVPFKFGKEYYNETFGTPTPWYNEDQTTERMDVIGQNGNEGEHYNK